ncbi:hypothetical protein [Labilibacter marinus]|uniref:hypothetical protein n=1 Tax=Labilibacter marinus TaxID=1477105 RepID=UPI00094F78DD|nr:hypothetical protein [Labilibacter marinus]
MRCFLKYIGLLLIVAGGVLLIFYTTLNRITNMHFLLAGLVELLGLSIYIVTNRFIKDKNPQDSCN